jgi:hypothetical protein
MDVDALLEESFSELISKTTRKKRTPKDNKPAIKIFEDEVCPSEVEKYARHVYHGKGGVIVYAAAGPCPAKLSDISEETVYDFCEEIVAYGITNRRVYTIDAIKSWAVSKYGRYSDEGELILGLIDEWYSEKMENALDMDEIESKMKESEDGNES